MRFTNKNIIITGGSSGIGADTAKRFARKGGKVFILDKNPPDEEYQNITYIHCDVSNFESVRDSVQRVLEVAKEIHILFANAGIHLFANIEETSIDEIDLVINVNLKGVLYALKTVLPIMKDQSYGSIVLMGSDQSLIGKEKSCVYGATKAAIAQIAKSTAIEYAKYNIRVNCVCPGTIDTPLMHAAVHRFFQITGTPAEEVIKSLEKAQPINRIGRVEDVSKAVLFLSSDKSSFTTGATLSIDGGYTAQ